MGDVIQILRELRQSSQSSVITGIEIASSDDRPSIEHPLESWLVDLILDQLTAPEGPTLSLIVLSGNAGDGKSYLLRNIRQRLDQEEGRDPQMVKWLFDATESSRQAQRSVDRLDEFFEPFGDAAEWSPQQLHIAVINTGTVVRFIAHDLTRSNYNILCDVLGCQLAINASTNLGDLPSYWERFDRVLVVDLDRRTLFPPNENTESFLDLMLATLDRSQPASFLATASTDCSTCPFAPHCPVNGAIPESW